MGLLDSIIKTFVGDKTKKDLKQISPLVDKINQYQKDFESLDHDKLRKKTEEFKSRLFDKNKMLFLFILQLILYLSKTHILILLILL